ncbi:glycoside hydrolase [Aspergillus pseudoustus]|uniref:Glycoside hydrolase n=1 Tax=Aspergillus pseudoustus TaxID=1810923 RepID=A0ABR4IAB5_9EURO
MKPFFYIGAFGTGLANGLLLPRQSNLTASTHCGTDLCTWWHGTGEVNSNSAVAPDAVRQSRQYLVQVAVAGSGKYFDSFVYEAIPRNGNGKIMKPGDSDGTFPDDDGISIELDEGINMAWSQFEHSQDVDVRILRRDGQPVDENVTIRPTALAFDTQHVAGALVIQVPASPNGYRFSVEFADDLFTYRSSGNGYTTDSSGETVGVEPRNALVIFASAFLPDDQIPALDGPNTKAMTPGAFSVADIGGAPIVYFPPGVYWIDSEPLGLAHIKLDPSTYWVHLAPGAFVKGAVEYTTANKDFYATGHGVLSGEIYVYQANADKGYVAEKSDLTSLRMWWHRGVQGGQVWHSAGPTISSPPFNTMDLKDGSTDRDDISMDVFDYKQVGAFFMQTDGLQMYTDAKVRDVFYHCNDDGIKTYHSGVTATDLVIWKVFNDPIIQMGWQPRDVHGITIDTLHIIHTRYRKSETYVPSAIIGASPIYNGEPRLDPSLTISMSISNVVCEGPCPGLFRLTPLQNYADFEVAGVRYLDGLIGGSVPIGDSIIATTDDTTYPGSEDLSMGLQIEDWTVGGEKVTMGNAKDLGRWNINAAYDGQWSIA